MFCKYCGADIVNGRCVKCGKPVRLSDRSRELDRLMGREESENLPEIHLQDLTLSHQNDSRAGGSDSRNPVNCEDPVYSDDNRRRKRYAIPLLAAVLVSVVVGLLAWFVSGTINYNRGRESILSAATENVDIADEADRQNGRAEDVQAGFDESGSIEGNEVKQWESPEQTNQTAVDTEPLYSREDEQESFPGVRLIQGMLNELMDINLEEDGRYGELTELAVCAFQSAMGIEESGQVDALTLSRLLYALDRPHAFKARRDDRRADTAPTGHLQPESLVNKKAKNRSPTK